MFRDEPYRPVWLLPLMIIVVIGLYLLAAQRAPHPPAGFAGVLMHTIDGRSVTLTTLSEKKPLLLFIWGTGCGACPFTLPAVLSLGDKGRNVVILVRQSGDDIHVIRQLQSKNLALPVVNDPGGTLTADWEIDTLPAILILSKGKIVSSTTGWTSEWGIRLRLWWAKKSHR